MNTSNSNLSNLLLYASGESDCLVATDSELEIKTRCRAKVKKEGSITTPAKSFLDIIRSLPDADIKIKKLENDRVQITCASASFKIVGLPNDNFPALPELKETLVDIPAGVLLNLINK